MINNIGRAPFIEYTTDELQQLQNNQTEYELKLAERALEKLDPTSDNVKPLEDLPGLHELILKTIDAEFINSGKFFSDGFLSVIQDLQQKSHLNTIDIISCNIRNNEQFDSLGGLTVRYSTNITGAGGDWILESHNVNITPFYFTGDVRLYPYRLGGTIPNTRDEDNNWIIATPANLYWLMTYESNTGVAPNLSSSFIVSRDIDMDRYSDLNNGVLTPAKSIGTTVTFSGTFNGNDKTIKINTVSSTYTGFFAVISNATISNVNLVYTNNITIRNDILNGNVGGFYGKGMLISDDSIEGSVTNCNITFNGTAEIGSNGTVGGFCGQNTGHNIFECTLTFNENVNIRSTIFSGGFCGNHHGKHCSIRRCTAICATTTITGNICGGFCGLNNHGANNNSNIALCTVLFVAAVTIMHTSYGGGFCGHNTNSGNILYCTAIFVTTVTNNTYYGGFCGYNNRRCNIQDCTAIYNNYSITGSNITAITEKATPSVVNNTYSMTYETASPSATRIIPLYNTMIPATAA